MTDERGHVPPSSPKPPSGQPTVRFGGLAVLGVVSFLLVLVSGQTGGVSAALVVLGLPLLLLGLVVTIAGGVRWAGLASRRAGVALLVTGLVSIGAGGVAAPDVELTAEQNEAPAAAVPGATASPTPPPSPPATASEPAATAAEPASPSPSSEDGITGAEAGTALAVLGTLDVKGRAPRTGYDRDLFGQSWADTDRNGCDTRNDILRRDLDAAEARAGTNGCVVLSGTYTEPYSGRAVSFLQGEGTSELVQIDHVVALSDAWQKGAQRWSPARRLAFANDPLNLLAVDGSLNMQKGDGDAATWLPPNRPYRCAYVARQVAVKAKYGAWVTAAERDAIARVLSACPDEPVPSSDAPVEAPIAAHPPPPATPQAAAATPSDAGSCDPAYPGVCIPSYAEAGDLDCGDTPHRHFAVVAPDPHGFDGNNDGVGCES